MGLGSRKPKAGSAFHIYGVFGLLPNLSVKSDQKKVSRSRTSCPSHEMLRFLDVAISSRKRLLISDTSGSAGLGVRGNRTPGNELPTAQHTAHALF